MRLNWWRRLANKWRRTTEVRSARAARGPRKRRRWVLETLEDRTVPTSTIFIDFGDGLSGGGMQMEVRVLRDLFANSGLQGPDLEDSAYGLNDDTVLTFTPEGRIAGARNDVVELVNRYFRPFDVDVRRVSSANRNDIIAAMQANDALAKRNDSYVLVVQMETDNSAQLADPSIYGAMSKADKGNQNNRDDSSIVFANTIFDAFNGAGNVATAVANEVARCVGITFGLTFSNNNVNANVRMMASSDAVVEFSNNDAGRDHSAVFFTHLPLVKGEQSNLNVTQNAYNLLVADPQIGRRTFDAATGTPGIQYVTGTGAFDVIRLTRVGPGVISVEVDAFTDPTYANLIESFPAYNVTMQPGDILLVEAGAGQDQIIVDARIDETIEVHGMTGFDQLIIDGRNAVASATYQPFAAAHGSLGRGLALDRGTAYGGTIDLAAGAGRLDFYEFFDFAPATVTATNFATFRFASPNSTDVVSLGSQTLRDANQVLRTLNNLTGTSDGNSFAPFSFYGVNTVRIDLAANEVGSANDNAEVATSGFVSPGLANLRFLTGAGNDTLTLRFGNFSLPGGGSLTFEAGGPGDEDWIAVSNPPDGVNGNFDLGDAQLSSSLGGSVQLLNSVENALIVGGDGDNTYVVSGWSGGGLINGQTGLDTLVAVNTGDFVLGNTFLDRTNRRRLNLQGMDAANLSGLADDNRFDVSAWTGQGTIDGGGHVGGDVIAATHNGNITLTNTSLTRSGITDVINLLNVEQCDLTGGAAANTFTLNFWSGGGSVNGLGGTDTIAAFSSGNFVISDVLLQRTGFGDILLSEVESCLLTGDAATNNQFDVSGWTGTGTLNGQGGTDTLVANHATGPDVDFTLSNVSFSRSPGFGLMNLASIEVAILTGGNGDNVFDMGLWTGSGTIDGGPFSLGNLLRATANTNFTLTDTTIQQTSGGIVNLVSIQSVHLTGGAGNNVFTVSGRTVGTDIFVDGGSGGLDTIVATNSVAEFILSDQLLQRTGLVPIRLANVGAANLTGGPEANTFNVSQWRGSGVIDGNDPRPPIMGDVIVAESDTDFTLTQTALIRSSPYETLILRGIEVANLRGGSGLNLFTIDGWQGAGIIDGALPDDPNADGDRLEIVQDRDFILDDDNFTIPGIGQLTVISIEGYDFTGGPSDNVFDVRNWSKRTRLNGMGQANGDLVISIGDSSVVLSDSALLRNGRQPITLANIELANLTGTAGADTFDVGAWTGGGILNGGANPAGQGDRVVAVTNADFVLGDTSLFRSNGRNMTLDAIEIAQLTGGAGNNNFNVSNWTRNGYVAHLNGGGGTDTITAANNANFTLANASLVRSGIGAAVNLTAINMANLTGGNGNNTFTVSGWTGGRSGRIDGGGGNDQIVAINDVNFILSDFTMNRVGTSNLDLVSVETARLTGGASPNRFTVQNWTGTAHLDGAESGDTYEVNFRGFGAGTTNVNDSGAAGTDTAIGNGTINNDHFVLQATRVNLQAEKINFKRVEVVNVNAGDGDDTFTSGAKKLDKGVKQVLVSGGNGNDSFTITPTSAEFVLDGGDPTKPAVPGDTLRLVLKDARIVRLNLLGGGAGNIPFRNRKLLTFFNMETGFGGGLPDFLP